MNNFFDDFFENTALANIFVDNTPLNYTVRCTEARDKYWFAINVANFNKKYVKVELNDFEVSYMQLHYQNTANEVQTGPFILNGTQALAYMRIKQDAAGDFGRAVRLNNVISSAYSDLTMKSVDELRDLVNELLKDTASDIDGNAARGYLASVLALSTSPLKTKTLPDEGMYQATAKKGQTLFVIDSDKIKTAACDYIYNPVESGDISAKEQ